jgi:5-methylcytosine-specific restriction protein A
LATYLLNYNPIRWEWEGINEAINQLKQNGSYIDSWSCGNRKNIEVGDRVFVIKLGNEERGIIASGLVYNGWYQDISWDEEKVKAGRLANYIDVDFDIILNPKKNILKYEELQKGKLGNMEWSNQSSGIIIPSEIAIELERVWSNYNNNVTIQNNNTNRNELIPEEIVNSNNYFEGSTVKILVNRFERNAEARRVCIQHYGCKCYACKVTLADIYGERAKDFIHVHHIVPLRKIGKRYKLNPIKDLRPLCPNCHAVIHRYKPEITIEELIQIINENTN